MNLNPREAATLEALHMAVAAAMLRMQRANVPPDVQAMLAHGDERGTVPARIIHRAVEAGITAFLDHLNGTGRQAGFNLAREVEEVAKRAWSQP